MSSALSKDWMIRVKSLWGKGKPTGKGSARCTSRGLSRYTIDTCYFKHGFLPCYYFRNSDSTVHNVNVIGTTNPQQEPSSFTIQAPHQGPPLNLSLISIHNSYLCSNTQTMNCKIIPLIKSVPLWLVSLPPINLSYKPQEGNSFFSHNINLGHWCHRPHLPPFIIVYHIPVFFLYFLVGKSSIYIYIL